MNSYNVAKEDFIARPIALSSLVINTPYTLDNNTTAPKIAKLLSLPFGIRITSEVLRLGLFKFALHYVVLMFVGCIFLNFLYIPVNQKNIELLNSSKSLSNKQFNLLADEQEALSFNKLFENANSLPLVEPEKVFHAKDLKSLISSGISKKEKSGNYPSVQFAGF